MRIWGWEIVRGKKSDLTSRDTFIMTQEKREKPLNGLLGGKLKMSIRTTPHFSFYSLRGDMLFNCLSELFDVSTTSTRIPSCFFFGKFRNTARFVLLYEMIDFFIKKMKTIHSG